MREIKFRAWSIIEKAMLSHEYMCTCDLQYDDFVNNQESYPLMQYTGLKDKNGAEIYEGDVIKRTLRKYERSCEVRPLIMDDYFLLDRIKASGGGIYEVVGNIYENPELLKSQNENN